MSYWRCRYDQPPGHSGEECVSGPESGADHAPLVGTVGNAIPAEYVRLMP